MLHCVCSLSACPIIVYYTFNTHRCLTKTHIVYSLSATHTHTHTHTPPPCTESNARAHTHTHTHKVYYIILVIFNIVRYYKSTPLNLFSSPNRRQSAEFWKKIHIYKKHIDKESVLYKKAFTKETHFQWRIWIYQENYCFKENRYKLYHEISFPRFA